MPKRKTTWAVLAALLGSWLVAVPVALAEPPPWAPAHGYRAKKGKAPKHKHRHETREESYAAVGGLGIDLGTCYREQIGQILGGAAGGAAGSTIGKGDGKTVAVTAGTVIGFIVGGSIGRSMDQLDQNCVGQVLERADTGRTVRWKNPDGERYSVTPTRTFEQNGRYCREYRSTGILGGGEQVLTGTACRNPDGTWQLVS